MTTETRETALWISDHPCYIYDNDNNNPYRLTLYVADDGIIMLGADGNGCADDIVLDDINGWSDEEITEQYGELDLDQLRDDAAALREAGREDDADWLDGWIDRADKARDAEDED